MVVEGVVGHGYSDDRGDTADEDVEVLGEISVVGKAASFLLAELRWPRLIEDVEAFGEGELDVVDGRMSRMSAELDE